MSNATTGQPPPLEGIRVLELAGLAPGPYAGLFYADFGAAVLRVDRAHPETSISVNMRLPGGIDLIKALIPHIDVIIDPFRPRVLEKMDLSPPFLANLNPRLILARLTGFRRDGKYRDMAGHDINYIAISGVLSLLGPQHEKPYPPGNIVGDFAGGGATCFIGILLALLSREKTGLAQVVEANMVDESASLATMPRLSSKRPIRNQPRGTNRLDGGCPYYDTYKTKDGRYMSVGALEPHFYAELLKRLGIGEESLRGDCRDTKTWPRQAELFTARFRSKTRAEWERVFDSSDACCVPVLTMQELQDSGFDQRPMVTLKSTPGLAMQQTSTSDRPVVEGQGFGVEGSGWSSSGLSPGVGGEDTLASWTNWRRDEHYVVKGGALEVVAESFRPRL